MRTHAIGRRAFMQLRLMSHTFGESGAVPVGDAPTERSDSAGVHLAAPTRHDSETPPFRRHARARTGPLTLTMRARIDRFACLASATQSCTTCIEHCPVPGAITLVGAVPTVSVDLCDGCGACERACPAPQGAIRVLPVLPTSARGLAR